MYLTIIFLIIIMLAQKLLKICLFSGSFAYTKFQGKSPKQSRLSLPENIFITERAKFATVRVTKPPYGTDDYYYALLQLYLPHRNDENLIYPFTNSKEAFLNKYMNFDRQALCL